MSITCTPKRQTEFRIPATIGGESAWFTWPHISDNPPSLHGQTLESWMRIVAERIALTGVTIAWPSYPVGSGVSPGMYPTDGFYDVARAAWDSLAQADGLVTEDDGGLAALTTWELVSQLWLYYCTHLQGTQWVDTQGVEVVDIGTQFHQTAEGTGVFPPLMVTPVSSYVAVTKATYQTVMVTMHYWINRMHVLQEAASWESGVGVLSDAGPGVNTIETMGAAWSAIAGTPTWAIVTLPETDRAIRTAGTAVLDVPAHDHTPDEWSASYRALRSKFNWGLDMIARLQSNPDGVPYTVKSWLFYRIQRANNPTTWFNEIAPRAPVVPNTWHYHKEVTMTAVIGPQIETDWINNYQLVGSAEFHGEDRLMAVRTLIEPEFRYSFCQLS